MNRKKSSKLLVLGVVFCAAASICYSLVRTLDTGEWPDSWPKELEPLRSESRTIQMAAGNQQDVYEIPFQDRDRFEFLWPVILSLKTPEAPLRLSRVNPEKPSSLMSYAHPAVRIYAPPKTWAAGPGGAEGEAMAKLNEEMLTAPPERRKELEREFAALLRKGREEGRISRPGPPWSKDLISESGALPEYICQQNVDGKSKWVAVKSGERDPGFMYRARVEIELVVDGKVIDLNRISFPPDTPIKDTRFVEKHGE